MGRKTALGQATEEERPRTEEETVSRARMIASTYNEEAGLPVVSVVAGRRGAESKRSVDFASSPSRSLRLCLGHSRPPGRS